MADTLTPNIRLTNQTEGGNNNSWGTIADANIEQIDNKFRDTTSITGPEAMRPSTSIAKPSLVHSSVTVRHCNC